MSTHEDGQSSQQQQPSRQQQQQQEHLTRTPLRNALQDEQEETTNDNSIMDKVKLRVSSIVPDSISKWFSTPPPAPTQSSTSQQQHNGNAAGSSAAITSHDATVLAAGNVSRKRGRRRIELEAAEDDADQVFDINFCANAEGLDAEEVALAECIAEHDLADEDEQTRRNEYGNVNDNLLRKRRLFPSIYDSRVAAAYRLIDNDADKAEEDDDEEDDEDDVDEEEQGHTNALEPEQANQANFQRLNAVRYSRLCSENALQPVKPLGQHLAKRKRLMQPQEFDSTHYSPQLSLRRQSLLFSTPTNAASSNSSNTLPPSTIRSVAPNRLGHMNLYGHQRQREPAFSFFANSCNASGATGNEAAVAISGDLPNTHQAEATSGKFNMSSRRSLKIPMTDRNYCQLPSYKRQPLFSGNRALPLRTSTTIDEVTEDDPRMAATSGSATTNDILPNSDSIKRPEVLVPPNNNNNNNYVIFANKRSRISSSEIAADSHSEYSEESQPNHYPNYDYKGRRFINRASNLEFYGNLQSRKSIFANNTGVAAGLGQSSMAHHNSTLSLNSLSRRRQFNASIYGSTSALSDSRLFTNSASPFYQGRTIYGGSSANKRAFTTELALSRPLAPAAAPPVIGSISLPVQIRPKSTDASSGSLTESAGLSKTARRILDLLDTYSTPLSDAKKIGTTLREHQQQRNAKRSAFAQSPYARPHALNNTNESVVESSRANDLLAPTMKKLLERRRLQCITESTRELLYAEQMKQAASRRELDRTLVKRLGSSSNSNTNSLKTDDHSQTISAVDKADKPTQSQPQTQSIQSHSHTNKMRSRLSHQSRKSKEMREQEDEPPTALNLPNIVFPEMATAPKFDLILPIPGGSNRSNSTAVKQEVTKSPPQTHIKATSKTPNFVFSAPLPLEGQARVLPKSGDRQKFKFAEPLPLKMDQKKNSPILINGTNSSSSCSSNLHATGSVMDVILPNSMTTSTSSSSRKNDGFGNLFKNHSNEWECETCMIKNKLEVLKCVACETPKPKPKEPKPVNSVPAAVCGFGDRFKMPTSSWECDACMLSNKAEDSKCIACETPRKSAAAAAPATVKLNTSSMAHSFGNAFKPKSNTWECDTCMIVNQENATECVACQTPNPKGHAVKTNSSSNKVSSSTNSSSFQFGFAAVNPKADTGFQQLVAAQKSSSWNCDVCMAQNDNTRTKCICCEQLKPGTGSKSNKFSFGSSHMVAAAQFGFAAAGGEKAKTEESNKPSGFVFGSEPGKDTGKDVADSNKTDGPKPTFMFGAPAVSVTPATEPAKSSTAATATIITTASSTTGFNFGTLNKQSAANTTQFNTASKPIAEIMFGSAATTNATTAAGTTTTTAGTNLFNFGSVASSSIVSSSTSSFSSANITTTTAISSSGNTITSPALNFNFPGPAAKTLGSSSTSVTVSSTTLPMTSLFGSSNNSNTTAPTSTNTTTVNDMPFVFGSKPAVGTTGGSNSTSVTKPEATPALSTFFFGQPPSTTTATASNLSSIFGIPSSTSTAAKISNNTNTTSSANSSTAATPFTFGANGGTTNQVGSTTNPMAATPFAFGAPTFKPEAQTATTTAQPIFGASSNTSTPLFGKTSTGPTMFGNTNGPVFGSVGANGGSNMSHIPTSTPTPALCSPFGAAVTQPASTFGSAASNPFGATNIATPPPANMFNQPNATSAGVAKPFGGFGNPAPSMTSNTTISQPSSKPAFNFGSSVAAPANPAPGGFNFNFSGGTAAAAPAAASGLKPAFNFTGAASGSSQPATFNFTGAGSNATTTGNNDSRPFQFNAVSVNNNAVPAPQNQMLNFTAAPPYMQTPPNAAPFQFNAGASAPANIFALNPPAAGSQAQNAQMVRRKIRAPNRRLPPR